MARIVPDMPGFRAPARNDRELLFARRFLLRGQASIAVQAFSPDRGTCRTGLTKSALETLSFRPNWLKDSTRRADSSGTFPGFIQPVQRFVGIADKARAGDNGNFAFIALVEQRFPCRFFAHNFVQGKQRRVPANPDGKRLYRRFGANTQQADVPSIGSDGREGARRLVKAHLLSRVRGIICAAALDDAQLRHIRL